MYRGVGGFGVAVTVGATVDEGRGVARVTLEDGRGVARVTVEDGRGVARGLWVAVGRGEGAAAALFPSTS